MQLFITADNGSILRISDGKGAYLTLRIDGNSADILSVTVPQEHRRRGIGSALLLAAERLLAERNVTLASADYMDSIGGMREFFVRNGYEVSENFRFFSMGKGLKYNRPVVEKLIKHATANAKVVRLSQLGISGWDQLQAFLLMEGFPASCYDLAHLDQQKSVAVYDPAGRICTLFLSSVREKRVYIELIHSRHGADNRYTLAAFRAFAASVMGYGTKSPYDQVIFASHNPGAKIFTDHICAEDEKPLRAGRCMRACKRIESNQWQEDEPLIRKIEEGSESEWMRESSRIPMQRNISWKKPWVRAHAGNRGDG